VTHQDAGTFLAGPERTITRFGEPAAFREGLYRVAEDTFAWMVPSGSWGETNIGLIRCGRQSVLIDTCWSTTYTREMLMFASDFLTQAPVEVVINTHADGDHCWGNQLFAGREIIATHACIRQMHHLSPRSLAALALASRLGRHSPHAPTARFGQYMHAMLQPYDFRDIAITVPTTGFSKRKSINVGGVDILLLEVGPGHTDGDAVVFVPERRVAYCGDIAFIGSTPVMWSGPVSKLVAALRSVLALDADLFIAGHGPIATRDDLTLLIDYWEYAQDRIGFHHRRGVPPAVAAREVLRSRDFQQRPWARWDCPERLVTNAFTLYRHWGTTTPLLRLGPVNVLWHQAQVALGS
jgi:cyclase